MPKEYKNKPIAVIGASENIQKYGYKIFHALHRQGFTVYGINPKGGQADGQTFYPSLQDVPGPVEVAIMVIPPAALLPAVEACRQKGVREIWFQPGAQEEAAFQAAEQAGLRAFNLCFMAENGLW